MERQLSFGEKLENYLSELGHWHVWKGIIIGQVLSLLLSVKCILCTLLQSATWQFPATAQLIVPYIILFIIFMPILACKSLKGPFWKRPWMYLLCSILDVEACFLLVLSQSGVGVALLGGAMAGHRLGATHVGGATAGLMAVGCIVWADVEGAPIDGRNQLVGDMLCLGGSLLFAIVTVLQEVIVKKHSCVEYLAMVGLFSTITSSVQIFVMESEEIYKFHWYNVEMLAQYGCFTLIQLLFMSIMSVMLRDSGAVTLHLSFISADYYTLISGIILFQFKFHGLYFLSYFLAMVGVILFNARKRCPPPIQEEPPPVEIPQVNNLPDISLNQDNISREFIVPTLDCIPLDGLEPPLSRDTTFTSFLGGPVNHNINIYNGNGFC